MPALSDLKIRALSTQLVEEIIGCVWNSGPNRRIPTPLLDRLAALLAAEKTSAAGPATATATCSATVKGGVPAIGAEELRLQLCQILDIDATSVGAAHQIVGEVELLRQRDGLARKQAEQPDSSQPTSHDSQDLPPTLFADPIQKRAKEIRAAIFRNDTENESLWREYCQIFPAGVIDGEDIAWATAHGGCIKRDPEMHESSEFFARWPGGVEEVQASLDNWRRQWGEAMVVACLLFTNQPLSAKQREGFVTLVRHHALLSSSDASLGLPPLPSIEEPEGQIQGAYARLMMYYWRAKAEGQSSVRLIVEPGDKERPRVSITLLAGRNVQLATVSGSTRDEAAARMLADNTAKTVLRTMGSIDPQE